MYYPCNESKGADQLRGYREADLRLCFRICRLLVFSRGGSFIYKQKSKDRHILIKSFVRKFTVRITAVVKDLEPRKSLFNLL